MNGHIKATQGNGVLLIRRIRFAASGIAWLIAMGGLMAMAGPVDGRSAKTLKLIMSAPETLPPGAAELSAWIHELNAAHHAAADKAAQRLVAAGDGAITAIKHALAGRTLPLERKHLRALLARIAEADALRGPLVTLKLHHAALRTVISRLCEQGGITPDFYPPFASGVPIPRYFDRLTLTVAVWREPFWRVMRHLARITGAGPAPIDLMSPRLNFIAPESRAANTNATQPTAVFERKTLVISPKTQPTAVFRRKTFVISPKIFRKGTLIGANGAFLVVIEPPVASLQSGAIRLSHRYLKPHLAHSGPPVTPALKGGGRRISIPPREAHRHEIVSLQIKVLWCPGDNWLTHVGPPESLQAVDDKGKSLCGLKQPGGGRNAYWGHGEQQIVFDAEVWLKRPSPGARVISVLRGQIPVVLSYGARVHTLTNLAAGGAARVCGFHLRFGKPRQQGIQWALPFTIDTPMMGSRKSRLISQFTASDRLGWGPNLVLKDKSGRILSFSGGPSGTGAAAYYHWSLSVRGEPSIAKLVMYPYLKERLDIPFEFRNVPIRDLQHVVAGNGW